MPADVHATAPIPAVFEASITGAIGQHVAAPDPHVQYSLEEQEIVGIQRNGDLITRVVYGGGRPDRVIVYDAAHGNRVDTITEGSITMQVQYNSNGDVIGKVRI